MSRQERQADRPPHVLVATRDTPAARANVWGSEQELAFSGTQVVARPGVPLIGGWGRGIGVMADLDGAGPNPPIAVRVWAFNAAQAYDGDWQDDAEGDTSTREALKALLAQGVIRVAIQRKEETPHEFWSRIRARLNVTATE